MKHVVVLASGDEIELHWQQPNLEPTVSEVLTIPAKRATHEAIVRLSPWTQHHPNCGRVTRARVCDCGLNAALAPHQWRI